MKRISHISIACMLLSLLLLLTALCACAVSGAGTGTGDPTEPPSTTPALPESTPIPEGDLSTGSATEAKGYVLVSSATQAGWLVLPSEGETVYPLVQVLPDGSTAVNLIHLTPDGVYMEDSTCENHDCVEQGTVTLENRYERILSNMIICLPNQVILQLYDPEEVRALVERGMPSP